MVTAREGPLDERSCSISCVTSSRTIQASNVSEGRRNRNHLQEVEAQLYILLYAFTGYNREVLMHMLRKSCSEEALYSSAYRYFYIETFRRYAMDMYRPFGTCRRSHRVRILLRFLHIADRGWTRNLDQLVDSLKALDADAVKLLQKFLGDQGPSYSIHIRGYNKGVSSERERREAHPKAFQPRASSVEKGFGVRNKIEGFTMVHGKEEVFVVAVSQENCGELEVILESDLGHRKRPSRSLLLL